MDSTVENSEAQPEATTATPSIRWSMSHVPSHLRLWLITAVGLVADLWSKDWAFSKFSPAEPKVVFENLCNIQLSLNPGALFGLGAGMAPIFVGASVLALFFVLYLFANSPANRWSMHIALGLVLGGALGNLYDRTLMKAYVVHLPATATRPAARDIGVLIPEKSNDRYVTLGDFPLGIENRRTLPRPTDTKSGWQPVVRDFIQIKATIGSWSLWPWIFNIADALLVVGVGILLVNFWFDRHGDEPHAEQAKAAAVP